MSGNSAIKGGGAGGGPLMANAILNFHFDYLTPSLNVSSAIGFRWPEWKAIIGMFCQTFLADLDLSSLTDIGIVYGIP